jgi:hypothetical protein
VSQPQPSNLPQADPRIHQPSINALQPAQPQAALTQALPSQGLAAASEPVLVPNDRAPRGQRAHVIASDSFTLTRTTYRVPKNAAESLKAFLEQNLSWPHLMSVQSVGQGVAEDLDPVRDEVLRSTTTGVLEETVNPADSREMHLVVTASPAAQEVIGNLIGLMLQSQPRPADSELHIGLRRE